MTGENEFVVPPEATCLYRGPHAKSGDPWCGVAYKDHEGLDHEFFALFRIGEWRGAEPDSA